MNDTGRRHRRLAFILCALLGLAAGLYVTLPPLVLRLATETLLRLGITNLSYEKPRAGLRQATAEALRFTYVTDSATVSGQIETLSIGYSLPEIIRLQGIPRITAAGAAIAVIPATETASTPPSLAPISIYEVVNRMPFETLSLLHARITTPVAQVFGDLSIQPRPNSEHLITASEGTRIEVQGDLSRSDTAVRFLDRAIVRILPQSIRIQDLGALVEGMTFTFPQMRIVTSPAQVSVTSAELLDTGYETRGDLTLPELKLEAAGYGLTSTAWQADWEMTSSGIALKAAGGNGRYRVTLKTSGETGTMTAQAKLPPFTSATPLSSYAAAWDWPADVTSGSAELSASAAWGATPKTAMSFLGKGLAGKAAALDFSNGELDGVLNLGGKKPALVFRSASAELLGARVEMKSATIPLNEERWEIPVIVNNLSLENVLALYPQQSLFATGNLRIDAILRHRKEGFYIENGEVRSAGPGIIRFAGGEEGSSLAVALEALKNFHYEELTARADLRTSGDLVLAVALKGRNPDWQNGRLTHFNINIEENVFKLFRSIRLARGEDEEISGIVDKEIERTRPR